MQLKRHTTSSLALLLTLAALSACDGVDSEDAPLDLASALADDVDADGPDDVDDDAALDELALPREPNATYTGWTPYTSEEFPPVGCDPGSRVTGVGCQGSNCDNIRLHCATGGGTVYSTWWTTYFSEEGDNYRDCGLYAHVTGVACSGSKCDNIALQCARTMPWNAWPPKSPPKCQWTGWMSEEYGGTLWLTGGKVRGVQCSGGYCDNKRYLMCDN